MDRHPRPANGRTDSPDAEERSNAGAPALQPLIYQELRGLARAAFASQNRNHTLQPTALVHEAWLKLQGSLDRVRDRRHFLALAATAMRQVLADHAKSQRRQRRGGGARSVTFHGGEVEDARAFDLVAFDDALQSLARINERHARIVELRFLASLTIAETAAELGVSETTVASDWVMARAWLRRELAAE